MGDLTITIDNQERKRSALMLRLESNGRCSVIHNKSTPQTFYWMDPPISPSLHSCKIVCILGILGSWWTRGWRRWVSWWVIVSDVQDNVGEIRMLVCGRKHHMFNMTGWIAWSPSHYRGALCMEVVSKNQSQCRLRANNRVFIFYR